MKTLGELQDVAAARWAVQHSARVGCRSSSSGRHTPLFRVAGVSQAEILPSSREIRAPCGYVNRLAQTRYTWRDQPFRRHRKSDSAGRTGGRFERWPKIKTASENSRRQAARQSLAFTKPLLGPGTSICKFGVLILVFRRDPQPPLHLIGGTFHMFTIHEGPPMSDTRQTRPNAFSFPHSCQGGTI